MVGFDNFDVVAVVECACGHVEQAQHHVHAHTHVGRHDDGHVLRVLGNQRLLCFAETGGADHGFDAQFAARRHMLERAFGAREIDQHVRTLQALTHIATQIEGAAERAVGCGLDGVDQHLTHAPRGARHGDAQRP